MQEINLKVGVDDAQLKENVHTFQSLRTELRAARGELSQLEQGSDAFTKAATKAGELNHEIQQISKNISAQTGAPIQRLGAQFGLLKQSVMELNFTDAGAQLSTLSKTINSMDVETLAKGFKSFGGGLVDLATTIMANPIFILAAVVAGVVAVLWKLPDALNEGNKSFEAAEKIIGQVADNTQKLRTELQGLIIDNQVLTGGMSKTSGEQLKVSNETNQKLIEMRKKQSDELKKINEDFDKEREDDGFKATKSILDAAGFETSATEKKNTAILELNKKYNEQRDTILAIEGEKIKNEVTKTDQEEEKKAAEKTAKQEKIDAEKLKKKEEADKKYMDLRKKNLDELIKFTEAQTKTAQATEQDKINYELKMLSDEALQKKNIAIKSGTDRATAESIYELAVANIKASAQVKQKALDEKELAQAATHQKEMDVITKKNMAEELSLLDSHMKEMKLKNQDSYAIEKQILQAKLDAVLKSETSSYEERVAAQADFDDKLNQLDKAKIAQDQANRDARIQIAGSLVDGLSELGGMMIKDGKQAFEFQKDITLAKIAIDTASAISSAVAESEAMGSAAGPAGPVVAAAAFAASLVRILANIASAKKLLDTGYTVPGGSSGSTGSSAASYQAAPQSPTILGNAPTVGANYFNQSTVGASGGNSGGGNRVYVLESDITSTQSRVKVLQSNSVI